jgi:2-hydroxychromene-2-carboxylate isomerase/uncharacterized protein (DUF1330 family)
MSANATKLTSASASETKVAAPKVFEVDVFWSMRSPYCYIALDRILEMQKTYNVKMNLRPVWPIAIWDPEFFNGIQYMKYRVPYQDMDTLRSAQSNNVPYKYPDPDPVLQEPNFGPVKPFKDQILIQRLTRTAVAAAEMGKGWDYLDEVSRMMWNGMVSRWDKANHLRDAINRAGIDGDGLINEVMNKNPDKYDALIERNHKLQESNLAAHTGVPNFVFNQEPFFGQDRMDQLLWRLKQHGLQAATETGLTAGIVSREKPATFVEAVGRINATPEFFDALAKQPDKGPTINLNLLRYRPRGDSKRYDLYGAVAGKEIVGVGGDIIFHGEAITDVQKIFEMSANWDGVAYAMYPRRAAYLQLQRDVDYQMAIPDRVAGTYERMLYLLSDGEAIYEATGSIENFHGNNTRVPFEEGNVVVSEFLRFKKPHGRKTYEKFAAAFAPMLNKTGGEVVLSVRAEMPIVSEEYWDHFVSFRFTSLEVMMDLYRSDDFQEINVHRIQGLDGTLAVVSRPQKVPAKLEN